MLFMDIHIVEEGNIMYKIKVAVIGIGAMGKGIIQTVYGQPDMEIVAVADRSIGRKFSNINRYLAHKGFATEIPSRILKIKEVDVLIDSTPCVYETIPVIKQALELSIPVILMNSEVDLVYGRLLAKWARDNKTIITSDAGDQHGVLMRTIEDVKSMGLEIVMAGNNKGFLWRYANPVTQKSFAEREEISLRQATQNADGTKLATEMALVANALDFSIYRDGMIGQRVDYVREALNEFDLDEGRRLGGVVDYVFKARPPRSVFVIGYSDNSEIQFRMNYYKMGEGPYFLFLRPYHLCHFETPIAVRRVMEGKPILVQRKRKLEVHAYAKTNLKKGDILDGIGGYDLYGMLERPSSYDKLPIGLSKRVTLTKRKRKDSPIRWNDVKFPENDPRLILWKQQGDI